MENYFVSPKEFCDAQRKTVYLYEKVWMEGTTAMLHGPRFSPKTDMALHIVKNMSNEGRHALYVNVDRNLDAFCDIVKSIENITIFNPRFDAPDKEQRDFADIVFEGIEKAIEVTPSRIIIIDSINRIAALSFGKNASTTYLMKRIMALQLKHNLSALVIVHDVNRSTTRAVAAMSDCEIDITQGKAFESPNILSPDDEITSMAGYVPSYNHIPGATPLRNPESMPEKYPVTPEVSLIAHDAGSNEALESVSSECPGISESSSHSIDGSDRTIMISSAKPQITLRAVWP